MSLTVISVLMGPATIYVRDALFPDTQSTVHDNNYRPQDYKVRSLDASTCYAEPGTDN